MGDAPLDPLIDPAPSGNVAIPKDARNWAMLCHLSALLGFMTIPVMAHLIGPLVIWLLKRDDHPFIDEQGKESLNFQISMTIYFLASALLLCIFVGFVLWGIVAVMDFVFVIFAAIKAGDGVHYRYPLTIRFVR